MASPEPIPTRPSSSVHPHDRRREVGAGPGVPRRREGRVERQPVVGDVDGDDPAHRSPLGFGLAPVRSLRSLSRLIAIGVLPRPRPCGRPAARAADRRPVGTVDVHGQVLLRHLSRRRWVRAPAWRAQRGDGGRQAALGPQLPVAVAAPRRPRRRAPRPPVRTPRRRPRRSSPVRPPARSPPPRRRGGRRTGSPPRGESGRDSAAPRRPSRPPAPRWEVDVTSVNGTCVLAKGADVRRRRVYSRPRAGSW